ncbi:MAG: DNA polymerase III subunit delta [Christensenellales bacterium]
MRAFEINDTLKHGVGAIYFLDGDDYGLEFFVIQTIKRALYGGEGSLEVFNYDSSVVMEEVISNANSFSLFGSKKLIVYSMNKGNNGNKLSDGVDKLFIDYAQNPNEDCVLIFRDCGKALDCIKDYAISIDCNKAGWEELARYVSQTLAVRGYSVEKRAVKYFVECCGLDMGKIISELNKLMLYCAEDKTISQADVEEITTVDVENKIYDLSNAIRRGDNQRALELYDTMVKRGEKPSALLSSITSNFLRAFLIANTNATDEVIGKTLGLSAKAVKTNKNIVSESKSKIRGYVPSLKKILDELSELEYQFKTGAIEEESALAQAMTKLLSKKESV